MITGDQILLHLVGDYLTQSHWMATEKVKRTWPALLHAIVYTLPFLLLTQTIAALLIIGVTHFAIDRYRLARFVVYFKNNVLSPTPRWLPWYDCRATGYPSAVPPWLSVWLLIIADNTLHLICNGVALAWFG